METMKLTLTGKDAAGDEAYRSYFGYPISVIEMWRR